jgi:hypothetical protein
MGSRLNVPSDALKKPGPSVYAPEKVQKALLNKFEE